MTLDGLNAWKHLDGVSRSFAFCIRELKNPFRDQVALSYLLFRVLDCIEDADWSAVREQLEAFDEFDSACREPSASKLDHLRKRKMLGLTDQEKELWDEIPELWDCIASLPDPAKSLVFSHALVMCAGMKQFSNTVRNRSLGREELDLYCYYVAGVVGELLWDLWCFSTGGESDTKQRERAKGFGLFLQKVNIIKDHHKDKKEGRYFIASHDEALADLSKHRKEAFDFILGLPERDLGFRVFCLWSYFMGLATVASTIDETVPKLKREENKLVMRMLKTRSSNHSALKQLDSMVSESFELDRELLAALP